MPLDVSCRAEQLFGVCLWVTSSHGPAFVHYSLQQLSDLGSANYKSFDRAVVLDRAGEDPDQELFRNMLLRLSLQSTIGDI